MAAGAVAMLQHPSVEKPRGVPCYQERQMESANGAALLHYGDGAATAMVRWQLL